MADTKAGRKIANEDWENLKQEAEKGLNVAKESLEGVGEDLKKTAGALGEDLKKVADGIAQGFDEVEERGGTKIGKKTIRDGDSEKNVFVAFKDNLSSDNSSKKMQAWVILIGLLIIVCGILVAIFS